MNRRAAVIVVVAALTSALFASVATSGGVNLWNEPQWEPTPAQPSFDDVGDSESDDEPVESVETSQRDPLELPGWIEAIIRVILVAAATVAVIAALIAAWKRRPRLRWRRREVDDFEALPDVAATIIEEADAQRRLLRGGSPRNAIVQCWLRLEEDVAAAGLPRDIADTSVEFTERVLAGYAVDTDAIRRLSALYREARFSEHPIEESARDAALDSLEQIHEALADSIDRPTDLGTEVSA